MARIRPALGALLALLLAACGPVASPATALGSPVRAETPDGDRVYVMTSQWNTFNVLGRRTNRPSYTDLYIDVWAFDAADARPVWRTRVVKQRSGVNMGRALLGADGGRLWLVDGAGLVGLSLTDGTEVADTGAVEAANPALKGLMPTDEGLYRLDAGGLAFTAADGRAWRLDGQTLKAGPDAPPPAQPEEGVFIKARIGGGNSTYGFTKYDLQAGDRWLGVMSDTQVATMREQGHIGFGIIGGPPPRVKLYGARGRPGQLSGLAPLPEAPDFLDGHLLYDGRINNPPIMLFEPDSVLILHRDRLGDEGRLRLTRVSGPLGKPLWTAALPIARLEAVMPGERTIVLLGRRDEMSPRRTPNDNLPVSVDQLVSVDLKTGVQGVYGFRVLPTPGSKIPESSTPAG